MSAGVQVWLVPHTHWDREWYEPFAVFSERLVAMMDTLLDLGATGFPHFHLDGQTAMIDDYLARRPERADELAALVRSGQLSAGPWVTQMDEFLTSGESHIRNLEMGLHRASELGMALRLGYMPDQFGHIGQMPQILRLAGLDRAMVWRGVPASIDRTSFRWRAPDGSEVVTEYMVFGYANGASFEQTADPSSLEAAIADSVEALRPYAVDDRLVVMVGYDHAGPDATLPQRLTDPGVRIAGLSSFLDGRSEPETCRSGPASCGPRRAPTSCPTCTPHGYRRSASGAGSRRCWSASLNRSPRSRRGSAGRRTSCSEPGSCSCGTARTTRRAGARTTRSRSTSTRGSQRCARRART